VLQLLVTRDPAEVERLLQMLPPDYRAALDRLSPARAASRIRARIFLMHDANDTYLPVAGARKLAASMPPEARVRYTELRSFNHVVPGSVDDPKQLAGEMLKLLGHVNAVLQTALAS
jgi:dipeptidyl aminopeptidase/acylaminoacyl peptidase